MYTHIHTHTHTHIYIYISNFKILSILNDLECRSANLVNSYRNRMHFGHIHTSYVIKSVALFCYVYFTYIKGQSMPGS